MTTPMKHPIDLVGLRIDQPDDIIPYLIEIELPQDGNETSFLRVRETLSRIGVSRCIGEDKTLFQTCNILHKQGRYFIVHFKMMYILDGRHNHLSVADIERLNTIANLIQQWGLVRLVNPPQTDSPTAPISRIKIVKYADRDQWKFEPKYKVGENRGKNSSVNS